MECKVSRDVLASLEFRATVGVREFSSSGFTSVGFAVCSRGIDSVLEKKKIDMSSPCAA